MGKKYDLKEIRKEKNEPRKTWQQTCAVSIITEKGESLLNRSVVLCAVEWHIHVPKSSRPVVFALGHGFPG